MTAIVTAIGFTALFLQAAGRTAGAGNEAAGPEIESVCKDTYKDMFTDMRIDMCTDMRIDMCMDM